MRLWTGTSGRTHAHRICIDCILYWCTSALPPSFKSGNLRSQTKHTVIESIHSCTCCVYALWQFGFINVNSNCVCRPCNSDTVFGSSCHHRLPRPLDALLGARPRAPPRPRSLRAVARPCRQLKPTGSINSDNWNEIWYEVGRLPGHTNGAAKAAMPHTCFQERQKSLGKKARRQWVPTQLGSFAKLDPDANVVNFETNPCVSSQTHLPRWPAPS
jgi:hypothetical protein